MFLYVIHQIRHFFCISKEVSTDTFLKEITVKVY